MESGYLGSNPSCLHVVSHLIYETKFPYSLNLKALWQSGERTLGTLGWYKSNPNGREASEDGNLLRRNGPKITLELDCSEEPQTEKVGSYVFLFFEF